MGAPAAAATHRTDDLDAELEQSLAQGAHLGAGEARADSGAADLLHQNVGRRGQRHAQLVGEEPRAAGAVERQAVMQRLDAVLDLAPLAVDPLVQPLGADFKLVTTNRGLSRISRPACCTTSTLITTRRSRVQVLAA